MTKNGIFLSVVAVLLAAAYVYFFTDFFNKQTIQIITQIRPGRPSAIPRAGDESQVYPVSFAFDGKYKLTSVKVISTEDLATNKYATPVWHLISDSNSIPTKSFLYGQRIPGMKPAIPRTKPEPLQPDVPYTLMIETKSIKGQTNFHTREAVPPAHP